MREDGKLDYLEMPGGDLPAVKTFYADAFGWRFTDYGPDYAAFEQGLDGGFYAGGSGAPPVPVLYANDLEAMQAKVTQAGGAVLRRSTAFPAGGASISATRPATSWRSGAKAKSAS